MTALNTVFSLISAILVIYLVVILIRVASSWFAMGLNNEISRFLARVTDPYLRIFQRIKFLRLQSMDLSPIAALIVLQMLISIFSNLAAQNRIWAGLLLALLVQMISGALQFLFIFFGVIALIRWIAILARASASSRAWTTLDYFLSPMVYRMLGWFSPRRVVSYSTGLIIFIVIMIGLWLACDFGLGALSLAFFRLPF